MADSQEPYQKVQPEDSNSITQPDGKLINQSASSSLHHWQQASVQQQDYSQPAWKRYNFDTLTTAQYWAYGVGHFVNDTTSGCWFNYLLYYLKEVLKLEYASYCILSGQLADAVATPLVGYLSDRTETKIGKRMPWYIGGYLVIVVSFLPIWNGCLVCDWFHSDSDVLKAVYYVTLPATFNLGWASLQISHMSLVPSLSCGRTKRDQLNSLRNTFTFIAILLVYISALGLFQLVDDPFEEFRLLAFISVGVGTLTTIFFIWQINEPELMKSCKKCARDLGKILKERKRQKINMLTVKENDTESVASQNQLETEFAENKKGELVRQSVNRGSMAEEIVSWKQWFKEGAFYRFGMVYMFVRIYSNMIQTMLAFYLASVLEFKNKDDENVKTPIQIALIPLSLYLFSVLSSSQLSRMYQMMGKNWAMTIGTFLSVVTSAVLIFLTKDSRSVIYGVAPIMGIAQAITLNTGITLISDVIGLRGSSGAFVFGAYSFLDKISSGIVIFVCTDGSFFQDPFYIRWITVLVPGISSILGWVLVVTANKDSDKVEDDEGEFQKDNQESVMSKKYSLADELAS